MLTRGGAYNRNDDISTPPVQASQDPFHGAVTLAFTATGRRTCAHLLERQRLAAAGEAHARGGEQVHGRHHLVGGDRDT